jgi:hypothetical protein
MALIVTKPCFSYINYVFLSKKRLFVLVKANFAQC